MWERVFEIIRKEFLQTLRDPRRRILLIGPPLIQLIIFGYAVNLDVEDARLAWVDLDRTPHSRELRALFEGSIHFEIVSFPSTEEQVSLQLDRGDVQAVVRILPGFARDLLRGRNPAVQVLVDGTNSNTAGIVAGHAQQVVSSYAAATLRKLQPARAVASPAVAATAAPGSSPLNARARVWFNPNLKSREYFVPGVIVNIIALVTIMLTAMSIVREKEIGTMEQLMVTPIRPIELMLGKILPFAIVGLFEVALVTAAALVVFRIPFRGSIWMLLGASVAFLLTTLGVGLFISTISHTQQQAMMASTTFFMPAMMLSGFAFPIRNMPPVIQYLTYLNPLRYFMEIARGVFLKGTGAPALWPQMLALTLLGAMVLAFSSLRFRKRLD
ncbi:MAG: ABC transporter permease [Acidobacteria bacterium]|nr:ABC transporter permease [Acidobacteriota bacterium]